jgi:Tol biopolymer transport system component
LRGGRLLILAAACGILGGCAGSDEPRADTPAARTSAVGGRLAFLPPEGIAGPVRVMAAAGGQRPTATGPAGRLLWALAWAPDGRRIAVVYSGSRAARSVGTVEVRTGRSTTVLGPPAGRSPVDPTWYQVAWSPSGDRLALVHALPGDASSAGIDVVDLHGTVVARDAAPDVAPTSRISWSRNGGRLAYGTRAGRVRLLTVASGARQALTGRPLGSDPAWSPNGRLIALATSRGIVLVQPSRFGIRLLTRGGRADKTPTWSPDGRWIAYAHQTGSCDRPDAPCEQDLYRVRAAGGNPELIRRTPKPIETSPVWAPR